VGKCLRLFTDMERDDIETLEAQHAQEPGRRGAQRRLAAELTRLVHGQEGLAAAQRATDIFFGAEIQNLSDAQLAEIFADVPSKELPRDRLLGDGLALVDGLVESGLVKSKGEARRAITQGGVYVNNRRISMSIAGWAWMGWPANRSSSSAAAKETMPCCDSDRPEMVAASLFLPERLRLKFTF